MLDEKALSCDAAASAPSTATTGTAMPARRTALGVLAAAARLITLFSCEGAVCRPGFLVFLPSRVVPDLTNLPYEGSAPATRLASAARQA